MSNIPTIHGELPPVLSAADTIRLRELATPLFSDNLDRLIGTIGLTRYNSNGKLVGTALTVKSRPGDNIGMYLALAVMKPGHVVVVEGGGDLNNAICGDLMRSYAVSRGCAGFVIDGAIRDVGTFAAGDFPCYARGVSHRGPYKSGPAWLNVPVAIGGQVIQPGDVIVGDEDGLVAFSPDRIEVIAAAAEAKLEAERQIMEEIAGGAARQSWLYAALGAAGIEP